MNEPKRKSFIKDLAFEAPKLQRKKLHRVKLNPSSIKKQKLSQEKDDKEQKNNLKSSCVDSKLDLGPISRFILYFVANSFISTDYDKCLKVCSINFSYVANSPLFESNLLRFKALSLEYIFIQRTSDDIEDGQPELSSQKGVNMLLDAFLMVQNSLKIAQTSFHHG